MLRVCALIVVFLQNILLQLLSCNSKDHLRDPPVVPILYRREESASRSQRRLSACSKKELGDQAKKECVFLTPVLKSRALHYNPVISGEAYTLLNTQLVTKMERSVFL